MSYNYQQHGFEILDLFSAEQFALLRSYGLDVISKLFEPYISETLSERKIEHYHMWWKEKNIPHAAMMSAANRHLSPEDPIKGNILNANILNLLERLLGSKYKIWDEGLGWLGFRLIRPGYDDGYPFSCKNWGPAKNVISVWIPLFGFEQEMMLNLIPGSHQREYERVLPQNSRFTKDEYRLKITPPLDSSLRPKLNPGQAVIFHPKTIHEEKCGNGGVTRFSFEFRAHT